MAVWLAYVDQHAITALPNLFFFMFSFGLVFALPAAAIVIGISELRKLSNWWLFVLAGPLAFFVVTVPGSTSSSFSGSWPWILATALTGAIYWLIAWHLYPPRVTRTPTDESSAA
ncbi:hypothetical protein [Alteriqipengyuania lutimaris]|uniref:hypothetical protein n=1 Tax=Alteriqipengyuania lutimaris TaxID=1538146 RepID=UPI001CFD5A1A|nr:hypothetical protein [Alteriqipengyuania lutimaris]